MIEYIYYFKFRVIYWNGENILCVKLVYFVKILNNYSFFNSRKNFINDYLILIIFLKYFVDEIGGVI